ncbi:hypothetical protein ACH4T9_19110 [Micromonospora sp. NPDC020750]|uniref:hypothetical protein n=1 Tax=unclassified Micromonospora TaxID=2617518 RepID=UPI00378E7C13
MPNAIRMRLAAHADPAVRAALAARARDAPRELYERLIDDPDTRVREYLAERDDVPADLLARLAGDPDPQVRTTLARWWTQAPEAVRRVLLTDPVDEVRAAACATYYARLPHPVPPSELVTRLLADPVTHAGAVRHAILTPQLAAQLADDPDHQVRRQLAKHPQLPHQYATCSPTIPARTYASVSSAAGTRPSRHATGSMRTSSRASAH